MLEHDGAVQAPRGVIRKQGLLERQLTLPRQALQVRAIVKKPCWKRIWPAPLHWLQVVGCVPGAAPLPLQVSQLSWRGI